MFKSGRSFSSLVSRNKPKLPSNIYPGVYKIPCNWSCGYIGQTGKRVETQKNEHKKAVFLGKWNASALAEHMKAYSSILKA